MKKIKVKSVIFDEASGCELEIHTSRNHQFSDHFKAKLQAITSEYCSPRGNLLN